MLRSLIAIIAATLFGLTASKLVEGAGLTMVKELAATADISLQHQLALLLSWAIGAFVAAATALILGRRWAPLGALGASTVTLSAFMALIGAQFAWWAWPGAALATVGGGALALKLLKATAAVSQTRTGQEFFSS